MTTFPYKGGKSLAWDFTVVDTVCATYCQTSAEEPCKTAEQAELRKIHKYRHLTDFQTLFLLLGNTIVHTKMRGTDVARRCGTYSYGYLMISLSVLKKDALFFKSSRPVGAGGPRVPGCVWGGR